jgi:hypothetical protein
MPLAPSPLGRIRSIFDRLGTARQQKLAEIAAILIRPDQASISAPAMSIEEVTCI